MNNQQQIRKDSFVTVSQQVEHVLVVPTLLFREVGYFQGFCTEVEPYLKTLLDPAYTSFRPRDQMENDPSFKQLIPYCLFRFKNQLFHYKRGKLQGEGRLHSKRSIGVAGQESLRLGLSGSHAPRDRRRSASRIAISRYVRRSAQRRRIRSR